MPDGSATANLYRPKLATAIGEARRWMDEVVQGASYAEIAKKEDKGERQIRLLLPLAFTPPAMVRAIVDGTIRVSTVTDLARRIPLVWASVAP
jgi:hypothetical protein